MKIRSLKLKNRSFDNWHSQVEDHWDYEDFLADEGWRKDWISFDCVCYFDELDTVYAGIEVGERDKIVAGGPMRGFSLFSALGSIDAGVDALCVVPDGRFPNWTPDPCINCGRCIDICPIDLQVQLIARYAEFELFQGAKELSIAECFEEISGGEMERLPASGGWRQDVIEMGSHGSVEVLLFRRPDGVVVLADADLGSMLVEAPRNARCSATRGCGG